MIWLWIALALAMTLFLLKDKKIQPHNFLWAFLPIDNYGLQLAGFTLKPTILYSMFLVAYAIIMRKFKFKITQPVLISTALLAVSIAVSFVFRGSDNITTDIKTYILLFFTIIVAICAISLVEGRDDIRQIKDVMIATAIGFGIVFLGLYFLDLLGISLPAVKSTSYTEASIIRVFKTVTNGELSESIRLRGFNIDPNSSCICFVVGLACLLGDWIKKGGSFKNIIFTVIIFANIILTSSRTALITCIFIVIISVFRLFFSTVQSKRKLIFVGVILSSVFILSIITVYDNKTFSYIYDNLISGYENRTGLNDEYGRFSIWKEWFSLLNSKNWMCGVGFQNISETITLNRDAHNTIVQVICSSGFIVGSIYIFYFLFPLYFGIKRRLTDKKNAYFLTNFMIAYLGIFTILFTISNVVSLYNIFLAMLLYIIPGCLENEERLREGAL